MSYKLRSRRCSIELYEEIALYPERDGRLTLHADSLAEAYIYN